MPLTDHAIAAKDHLQANLQTITRTFHGQSDCYNGPIYDVPITD